MQLKQGSLSVADYTSKFEELCRFSKVCQGAPETYESWKCIKYQRGLKDNIMTAVTPMEIRFFSDLVNKARVVEEYAKTVATSKDTHGGSSSRGHGKYFHPRGLIGIGGCFNCGLPGHFVRDWTRGKNPSVGQSQHQGQVFAMNAKDDSKADPLMRGIYLIGDQTLIVLYDTGASHSFILFAKVEELSLKVSELPFDLHTIRFMPEGENGVVIAEGYYMNSVMVHCSGEECQGYILLAVNTLGDNQELDQIPMVRDFPEVFPKDIPEFPPQREIEFEIELVPGARPVSIAPYRMALIELAELKTQLEELLNKRFIRLSVSPWKRQFYW
ncbi:uncharacterized protein LOC110265037 [Arachis ipaensis]|uniref:uncharacterized protein LOC110265037 n=1 Tax=Arachis ipaensis TaxID=130454 RepID=UPI000A2B81DA|nr:uncharacterized protein LOC110265037 [Arachis ipaensis]XP_025664728.1 uncharacterized protein LOC112763214 [Arachis hypogaea]